MGRTPLLRHSQAQLQSRLLSSHLVVAAGGTRYLQWGKERCRGELWFFSADPSFSLFLCSGVGPPWARVRLGIYALPWSTYFSSDLDVCTAVSHSFSISLPMWCFLPCLKYVFREAAPAWLMSSAVSCGMEPAGTGHVQHGTAPSLF